MQQSETLPKEGISDLSEKSIVVISSEYTGHGHKSISTALGECIDCNHNNLQMDVINGFSLAGKVGQKAEKSYMPNIRYAKGLWKIIFDFTSKYSKLTNKVCAHFIEKSFLKYINEHKPDAIVTVHPGFVGSILDILEENNIDIPVIVIVADLLTFSKLWIDNRAVYTICPNQEVKERMLRHHIKEHTAKVYGFPLRKQFWEKPDLDKLNYPVKSDDPFRILILNASDKIKKVELMTRLLLENFNCTVTIICGRDQKLKDQLDKGILFDFPDNLIILGYVENMAYHMRQADLALTRAGPNTIMEAISCITPLIITGALPGQEQGNPVFIVNNGLGLELKRIKDLVKQVKKLTADDMKLLKEIKQNQLIFSNADSTEKISSLIEDVVCNNDVAG